ncbi:TRAP-type C4-dicarboxylate transport system, substrate-binding protein [Bosea sp. 62]|uniref:TRAP transporter substrate-binding protein n=1 Tax=unclassified Bosea (in: a-proteobacteria) TaxID=2653178 RepID=UPI00125B9DF5|nr:MULTISPECIES: TRAP transporter substrate-binding protein [unclassified Bosea (in: a-proteobacteria)]CAD5252695.1 TRAP-type C4-dicarboxylate transport system, substrate-binding protein [Bosea sp. 7B]CAD5278655.1 TRAP-type C4-dicarboxylate transport system, substrate-binding protein [Bosea sp. 21B]CAD5279764.1 TRAP-type C4-dicarboxylate transport system, substrate-binding protein [Bosea sp. 46]VVT59627.1 TRAP-type C4-dicarboxylate transport system, substrate-binding protein [Bosea sp. EC-HK365
MRRLVPIIALALSLSPAAFAQTVWEMPTEYPASAIPGEGVATFAKLVNERSGGRLTIIPSFDAAKGIKSAGMVAAVQEGKVAVGDAFAGALGSVHPLFGLSSLPFLATSIEDARRLTDLARPAYAEVFAGYGQRMLYTTPWPASGIWSKEPVASARDLAGLSIRTYDATSTTVMGNAGAKAVNLSFADAMPKVKDGSVTAVLSSGDGGAGRNLWQFLPHFSEVNYALPISLATVNLAAYEALPADLRQVVDEAAAETERRQWSAIRTRLDENYTRMRANGVTIHAKLPADLTQRLEAAGKAAVEDWRGKAGAEGAAILDAFAKR